MTRRTIIAVTGALVVVGFSAWALMVSLERVMRPAPSVHEEAPSADDRGPAPVRHIAATLFFASGDAQHLAAVQRDVLFGEGAVEQGRQIVLAQLEAEAQAPLLRAIPNGASLRSFYVSERGEAFVDLGPEILAAHPGGTTAEQLTVFAIVNAVTANLPAVTAVQLLVDGKEVDTLAGHVDVRRPLRRNDALVKAD